MIKIINTKHQPAIVTGDQLAKLDGGVYRRKGGGAIVFVVGTPGGGSSVFQICPDRDGECILSDLTACRSGWLSEKYEFELVPGGITLEIT